MVNIGPLEVDEVKILKFDFSTEAGPSVTLSNPVVTCVVYEGTDVAPTVLDGSPTIVAREVHQKVKAGLAGVTYKIRATVQDSSGQTHGITGLLDVVTG